MNSVRGSIKHQPVRGCLAKTACVKDDQQQQLESRSRDVVWHRHPSPCRTGVAAGTGHAPGWQRGRAGRDAGVPGMALAGLQAGGPSLPDEEGCLSAGGHQRVCVGGCVCNQYCLGLAKEGHLEIRKCLLMVCNCLALWFICCITLILNV